MTAGLRWIDWLSVALMWICTILLVALLAVTAMEVFARYVLGSPTIWGTDLATLLNGAVFALGLAYTLQVRGHVRIDVFAAALPPRAARLFDAVFLLALFAPCLAMVLATGLGATGEAVENGERMLTAWAPPLWPGYLALAVGVLALLLQVAATGIRDLQAAVARVKTRSDTTGEH